MQKYWRLITTFIYFGPPSLDLIFHVFFLQLSAARTRLWTIACSLLLAPAIRHHFAASIELDNDVNTIPWLVLIKYTSVHLVAQESRHPTQLPRTARLHRSISPVGIDGVQPVYARDDPQG
jgi:hypothetical protein